MKLINFILIIIFLAGNITFAQESEETPIKKGDWNWTLIEDFEINNIKQAISWPALNQKIISPDWFKRNPMIAVMYGASKYLEAENKEMCLGVKILMRDQGDTRKFILPISTPKIEGICQKLTFWVHSRNYLLTIRAIFKDYMNSFHYLEPDIFKLEFFGWKKVTINNIDIKIYDQLPTTDPFYKPLELCGFVIENPLKKTFLKKVYIYLDHVKAFTRVDTLTEYDGKEMRQRW